MFATRALLLTYIRQIISNIDQHRKNQYRYATALSPSKMADPSKERATKHKIVAQDTASSSQVKSGGNAFAQQKHAKHSTRMTGNAFYAATIDKALANPPTDIHPALRTSSDENKVIHSPTSDFFDMPDPDKVNATPTFRDRIEQKDLDKRAKLSTNIRKDSTTPVANAGTAVTKNDIGATPKKGVKAILGKVGKAFTITPDQSMSRSPSRKEADKTSPFRRSLTGRTSHQNGSPAMSQSPILEFTRITIPPTPPAKNTPPSVRAEYDAAVVEAGNGTETPSVARSRHLAYAVPEQGEIVVGFRNGGDSGIKAVPERTLSLPAIEEMSIRDASDNKSTAESIESSKSLDAINNTFSRQQGRLAARYQRDLSLEEMRTRIAIPHRSQVNSETGGVLPYHGLSSPEENPKHGKRLRIDRAGRSGVVRDDAETVPNIDGASSLSPEVRTGQTSKDDVSNLTREKPATQTDASHERASEGVKSPLVPNLAKPLTPTDQVEKDYQKLVAEAAAVKQVETERTEAQNREKFEQLAKAVGDYIAKSDNKYIKDVVSAAIAEHKHQEHDYVKMVLVQDSGNKFRTLTMGEVEKRDVQYTLPPGYSWARSCYAGQNLTLQQYNEKPALIEAAPPMTAERMRTMSSDEQARVRVGRLLETYLAKQVSMPDEKEEVKAIVEEVVKKRVKDLIRITVNVTLATFRREDAKYEHFVSEIAAIAKEEVDDVLAILMGGMDPTEFMDFMEMVSDLVARYSGSFVLSDFKNLVNEAGIAGETLDKTIMKADTTNEDLNNLVTQLRKNIAASGTQLTNLALYHSKVKAECVRVEARLEQAETRIAQAELRIAKTESVLPSESQVIASPLSLSGLRDVSRAASASVDVMIKEYRKHVDDHKGWLQEFKPSKEDD